MNSRSTATPQSITRRILLFAPGAVLPALIGIASSAVFTRLFAAGDYGQLSVALAWANLGAAFLGQWLVQSVTRLVPGAAADELRAYKMAISVACVAGTVIGVALICSYWFGLYIHDGTIPRLPLLAAGLAVSLALSQVLAATLQAMVRGLAFSGFRIAEVLLRFVLGLALVLIVAIRVEWVLVGAIGSIALLAPLVWNSLDLPNPLLLRQHDVARVRPVLTRFLSYGFPMTWWYASSVILSVGDRYVFAALGNHVGLGIYSANYNLVTGTVQLLATPVGLAAHPMLMAAWTAGETAEAAVWLRKLTMYFITSAVVLLAGTLVAAPYVVQFLLGEEFRQGYRVIPVVLLGQIVWQLGMFAHKPLEFAHRTREMLIASGICMTLSIALNLLLIARHGYMAAAWVTVASYSLYTAIVFWRGQSILSWSLPLRTAISAAALPIAMLIMLGIAARQGLLPRSPLLSAVIVGLVTLAGGIIAMNKLWTTDKLTS